MTQGTQSGALRQPQPRGVGWGGRWKGGSGERGHYVYLRLIHTDVLQKPTQYSEAIILKLKINKFQKISRDRCSCEERKKSREQKTGHGEY